MSFWEILAVVFEIISFFCVTIDLWGKERILKFQGRVYRMSEKFKTDENLDQSKYFNYLLIFLLLSIISIAIIRFVPFLDNLANQGLEEGHSFLYVFAVILVILFFVFITVSLYSIWITKMVYRIVHFLNRGISKCSRFLIKTLDKHKMEGVLIMIGAAFFLVSKAILLFTS